MNTTQVIYAEKAYSALLSLLVTSQGDGFGKLTEASHVFYARMKCESALAAIVRGFGSVSKIIDPNNLDNSVVPRNNNVEDVPRIPFPPPT